MRQRTCQLTLCDLCIKFSPHRDIWPFDFCRTLPILSKTFTIKIVVMKTQCKKWGLGKILVSAHLDIDKASWHGSAQVTPVENANSLPRLKLGSPSQSRSAALSVLCPASVTPQIRGRFHLILHISLWTAARRHICNSNARPAHGICKHHWQPDKFVSFFSLSQPLSDIKSLWYIFFMKIFVPSAKKLVS